MATEKFWGLRLCAIEVLPNAIQVLAPGGN